MKTLRLGLTKNVKEKFHYAMKGADETVGDQMRNYIDQTLTSKKTLSPAQKAQIKEAVLDEVLGLGPLGPALRHPKVANVYLEGTNRAYLELYGPRGSHHLQKVKLPFDSEAHLLDIIHRIVRPLGCELKSTTPVASCI